MLLAEIYLKRGVRGGGKSMLAKHVKLHQEYGNGIANDILAQSLIKVNYFYGKKIPRRILMVNFSISYIIPEIRQPLRSPPK